MLPADEESDPQIEASKNLLQRTQTGEHSPNHYKSKLLKEIQSHASRNDRSNNSKISKVQLIESEEREYNIIIDSFLKLGIPFMSCFIERFIKVAQEKIQNFEVLDLANAATMFVVSGFKVDQDFLQIYRKQVEEKFNEQVSVKLFSIVITFLAKAGFSPDTKFVNNSQKVILKEFSELTTKEKIQLIWSFARLSIIHDLTLQDNWCTWSKENFNDLSPRDQMVVSVALAKLKLDLQETVPILEQIKELEALVPFELSSSSTGSSLDTVLEEIEQSIGVYDPTQMKGSSSSKKPSKKKKGKQQSLEKTVKEEPEEKPRIKILQRKDRNSVCVDKKKQEQGDKELLREAQLEVLEELQNGNPSIPTKPKLNTKTVNLFYSAVDKKARNKPFDHLMKKAAEEGHPEAAYEYGEYLCEKCKYDEASFYYTFAHNNGYDEAAYNAAVKYQEMERYGDALQWYLKDLRRENTEDKKVNTVFNIGTIYEELNNISAVLKCAKFCADKGDKEAKRMLDRIFKKLIGENTPFYEDENDAKDLVSERISLEVVDSDTLPRDIWKELIENPQAKWADEEWADYSDLGEVEVSGAIEEEPKT